MNDKTSKKENEESLRFLMMKDKKHEDTLRQVIDNQYDNILKTFIDSTLKTKNFDIYNKWASIIKDVVKLCISKLNPSFRFNGDSLLITDYIKIKTILHTDRTLTRVISGFALQKNVCSKKMPTLLDTPKLLIMNCQVEQPDDMFINSIHNDKTNQNINTLQKQIEAVDPDLILFNKSIPHKLQERLIAKKTRAIVLNVKDKSLLNIARCTKTYALSSVSQLNKHMKLGECGKFRIDKYQNLKHNNFNLSPIKNDIIKTHEYYLMLFEGCEPTLFSTILLFGPNYEELRILKHLLNNVILLTARDFYLQKYFLYFSYIDIHQPYSFNNNNNNNNVNSPVDAFQITSTSSSSSKNVTTSINNGRISSYKKPKSSNAILPLTASSSVSTALPLGSAGTHNKQWMPFDEQSIEYGQSCLWFVKLTLVSNKNNVFFGGNNNVTQDTSDMSVGDAQSRNNNESEVLKKINYMCAYPENVKLMFYAKEDKDDKPLGKLIIDLCYKGRDKCDTCKRLNNNHIYIMYSTNGKLIMSFIQNKKENHLDKVLDFLNIIDTTEPPSSQDQPQQGSTDTTNQCKCKCNEHNTLCNNNNTTNINLPLNTTPTTQNTVAPPPVAPFTTSSQALLVNKFYGVNIKFPDNKINYNIDIYSYGYCRICCCIVTPLVKLPKELWNYSSTKYFKHFLFGNDLRNRNDKKESNLSWIYINKEYNDISCAHSAFHDIDRLFITQFGTIKLSYNKYTKYKMDYGLYNIKRGEYHLSLLTTLDNSISFSKHNTQKVLKYLMKNYNVARCEAKNLLDEIRLNNNIHTKHNISKILSTLIEWVNKYIIALQEFKMFIEYVLVVPAKFPTYVKLHLYVAKIYLKLVQFKLIDNNFREILRKVKNLFSLINTVSSPNFKINNGGSGDTGGDGNNSSGNKNKTVVTNNNNNVGNSKNNNIFLNDNLSPTPKQPPLQSKSPIVASSSTTIKHDIFIPLLNPVDNNNTTTTTTEHQSIILNGNDDSSCMIKKSQTFVLTLNTTTINNNNNNNYQCSSSFAFPRSEYIDLEYKDKYRYVLDYLAYYDEYHTEHTTHFNECDISSIIAYALTSDKYIQFMTAKDKFKLTSVRCERKLVKTDEHKQQSTNSSQFSNSNTFFQKIFSKDEDSNYQCFKTLNQSDVYNYFPIKNKSSLCDTSLLFDISRNTYYNVTIDKKDIAQELETQLLSTNTEHFVYEVKNFNMKRLHTLNVDFNYTNANQRSTEFIKANVFQNKDTSKDDNTQQQQQPQSQATTPTAATNTNITFTTQQQQQQQYKVITSTECNSFSSTEIKKTIDDLQCMKEELKQEKHNILTEHNINTSSPESKSKFEYSKLHKHTFIENETYSKTCEITVYYPRQFEALRIIYCATYNEFILSIAKSLSWQNVSGGKSKADFYKSIDNKYILKCLDKQEFNMFIKSAFQYFLHMNSYLFHKMPSALAKILGAFKIKIKYNLHSNMQSHYYYVVLMENALYNVDTEKSYIKVYDLKGSNINRYVPKSQIVPGKVQLDTNYKENSCGEPLVLDRSMMELLVAAVHNDSLMLNTINVIDYSLLVIVNEMERTIRFKLIDYIRKYTLDKQLEHVAKTIINGLNSPTIIGPNQYMERFMKALNEYFIGI